MRFTILKRCNYFNCASFEYCKKCDINILNKGKIEEQGTFEELVKEYCFNQSANNL